MLANDMKKGMEIVLKNGFEGKIDDNRKGNIRSMVVHGICGVEHSSGYIWDIARVQPVAGGAWERVELTEKQRQSKIMVNSFGF